MRLQRALFLAGALGCAGFGCGPGGQGSATVAESDAAARSETGQAETSRNRAALELPNVMAHLDLVTGALETATGATSIRTNAEMTRIVDASVKSATLKQKLEQAMEDGWSFMADQGSDPYSVQVRVFAIPSRSGGRAGYGVWCGAPGDIGSARLSTFDTRGNAVAVVLEDAYAREVETVVGKGIDLVQGTLNAGAKALALDGTLHVAEPDLAPELAARLDQAIDAGFERMTHQGSDPYSVSVVVFTQSDETGAHQGYGVWVGAPGDIGDAGLASFDAWGHWVGLSVETH